MLHHLAVDGRPFRTAVRIAAAVAAASSSVIEEILEVLIDNARRHGAGAVSLTMRATGRFLAVDVGDEGTGLANTGGLAFARRSGASTGHGIGLALAKSLAAAEGGDLAVAHTPAGPVFTLRLVKVAAGTGPGQTRLVGKADPLIAEGIARSRPHFSFSHSWHGVVEPLTVIRRRFGTLCFTP
ncbi:MAG: ATP-binding protein [Thermoleophilaceae bacterium]